MTLKVVPIKNGCFSVVDADTGRDVVGWAFSTLEQAEERLLSFSPSGAGGLHTAGPIEIKKKGKAMTREFLNFAARFSFTPGVGKWDRFTSWGTKVQDGQESIFVEDTLGQMVDNFGDRLNDLAMCYDHQSAYVQQNGQPAPALAFYSALALIIDGKVARFATHNDEVKEPDPTGLENGVYGYRARLTPLGEKLLPNYAYLSPMFTTEGADEEGNPIGYDIMDVAATNTPFQDGVALTFHKKKSNCGATRRFNQEGVPMNEVMAKLGLAEGASEEEKSAALAKYMEDAEACKAKLAKMGEEAAEEKKMGEEPEAEGEKKMADEPDADDKKEMGEEAAEMKKMARSLGLPGNASMKQIALAMELKTSPKSEIATMRKQVAQLKADAEKRNEEEKRAQAAELVDGAIKMGKLKKEKRASLMSYALTDFAACEKFVADLEITEPTELVVRQTFTKGGKPVAKATSNASSEEGFATETRIQGLTVEVRGGEFAAKARTFAKANKCSLAEAQREVLKLNPELSADLF